MGTRGTFPGIKRSGLEGEHSPPSSAQVKNAWSYTSAPPYVFMARFLVKHRMSPWRYIWLTIGILPSPLLLQMSSDFMSILQGTVPEDIPSQNYHMNEGPMGII
jgi:hypothetical protein